MALLTLPEQIKDYLAYVGGSETNYITFTKPYKTETHVQGIKVYAHNHTLGLIVDLYRQLFMVENYMIDGARDIQVLFGFERSPVGDIIVKGESAGKNILVEFTICRGSLESAITRKTNKGFSKPNMRILVADISGDPNAPPRLVGDWDCLGVSETTIQEVRGFLLLHKEWLEQNFTSREEENMFTAMKAPRVKRKMEVWETSSERLHRAMGNAHLVPPLKKIRPLECEVPSKPTKDRAEYVHSNFPFTGNGTKGVTFRDLINSRQELEVVDAGVLPGQLKVSEEQFLQRFKFLLREVEETMEGEGQLYMKAQVSNEDMWFRKGKKPVHQGPFKLRSFKPAEVGDCTGIIDSMLGLYAEQLPPQNELVVRKDLDIGVSYTLNNLGMDLVHAASRAAGILTTTTKVSPKAMEGKNTFIVPVTGFTRGDKETDPPNQDTQIYGFLLSDIPHMRMIRGGGEAHVIAITLTREVPVGSHGSFWMRGKGMKHFIGVRPTFISQGVLTHLAQSVSIHSHQVAAVVNHVRKYAAHHGKDEDAGAKYIKWLTTGQNMLRCDLECGWIAVKVFLNSGSAEEASAAAARRVKLQLQERGGANIYVQDPETFLTKLSGGTNSILGDGIHQLANFLGRHAIVLAGEQEVLEG